jgi:HEPN domain-containing protein
LKPATQEWLEKAEGDYRTALRERRARRHPNHDAVCFHAQQCIEKYLKALLTEHEISFPKIHDLVKLGEICFQIAPDLKSVEEELDLLSRYAVSFRYPGETAEQEEAKAAISAMAKVRKLIKGHLRETIGNR